MENIMDKILKQCHVEIVKGVYVLKVVRFHKHKVTVLYTHRAEDLKQIFELGTKYGFKRFWFKIPKEK